MIKCNLVIIFFRKPQYKSLKIIELIGRFNDLFYHKYSKYRCCFLIKNIVVLFDKKNVLSHIFFPQFFIYNKKNKTR